MLSGYQNRWINYPWQKEQGQDGLIHPDFLEIAYNLRGLGVCFCSNCDNGWLRIAVRESIILVSPRNSGVSLLPDPDFVWNEYVEILGKGTVAVVWGIAWHFKNSHYFYYLRGGKAINKRRYLSNEIKSLYAKQ